MFMIDVKFVGRQPPSANYSKMMIDEIFEHLCWEADLTIIYNNQVLFSEEISIVEFYWYLVNWYHKCLISNKEPFVYSTVEHTEPILFFFPQDGNHWKIDSVWKRNNRTVIIKEEILYCEVHKLLKKIMHELGDEGDKGTVLLSPG